jgi:hypothetical protein
MHGLAERGNLHPQEAFTESKRERSGNALVACDLYLFMHPLIELLGESEIIDGDCGFDRVGKLDGLSHFRVQPIMLQH